MFAVESVHQDDIGVVAEDFDVFRTVCFDNFKFSALERQLKQVAGNGDDLRIDVHGGLARVGQVGVCPACKRTAAQADLGDMLRQAFRKQQPAHHRAAVREHQLGRAVEVHRALNGVAAQVKRTDIAFFGNTDFGKAGFCRTQAAVGMSCHRCERSV